jgi:hypothetical protein
MGLVDKAKHILLAPIVGWPFGPVKRLPPYEGADYTVVNNPTSRNQDEQYRKV